MIEGNSICILLLALIVESDLRGKVLNKNHLMKYLTMKHSTFEWLLYLTVIGEH